MNLPNKRRKSHFSNDNNGMIAVIQNLADTLIAIAPSTVAPTSYMDKIKVPLDEVAGDDRDLYAECLEFLAINTILGEVFLRLDQDMRLGWLRKKLSIAWVCQLCWSSLSILCLEINRWMRTCVMFDYLNNIWFMYVFKHDCIRIILVTSTISLQICYGRGMTT